MLGLSVTGFSVADTLAELGADVLVVTEKADEEYERLLPVIGARLWTGALDAVPQELVDFAPEVVVASPGFAPRHPLIGWAQESASALWGDIELAWRVRDKVRARRRHRPPTGCSSRARTARPPPRGSTATMLVEGGLRAAPVGNIGTPVLDAVRDPAGFDVLVVELSSHQLWYLGLQSGPDPVSPHASVCLNLADDHLEWHGSAEAYRDAKAHVYDHTRVACVYNKADAATRRMVEDADVVEGARAIGFDLGVPGPSDLGVVDGILVDRAFLDDRRTQRARADDGRRARGARTRRAARRREHPRGRGARALARRAARGDPRGAARLPPRPAPHRGRRRRRRASPGSTTRRRRTRTPRRRRWPPTPAPSGSSAGCSRASTSRTSSPGAARAPRPRS